MTSMAGEVFDEFDGDALAMGEEISRLRAANAALAETLRACHAVFNGLSAASVYPSIVTALAAHDASRRSYV